MPIGLKLFKQDSSNPETEFLSVVIAAQAMQEVPTTLISARPKLDAMARPYEVICVTDGRDNAIIAALEAMREDWSELVVIGLRPWSGDDAALLVALRRARGPLILTMAGWPEVDPDELPRLVEAIGDFDMVSVLRSDRPQKGWQAWRRRRFTGLLSTLFGESPGDPFCRTRIARKEVLEDVAGFGTRQHFIPIIAGQRGYKLDEIELRGTTSTGRARYVFDPMGHVTGLFDSITLYVVLKFLRRPLRFFGSIGAPILLLGLIATAVLVTQKLMGQPLGDRPALIFAVLMVVLGIQIIAIGLVGEIIIFANSRRMKQYSVREIITQDGLSFAAMPDSAPVVAPTRAEENRENRETT